MAEIVLKSLHSEKSLKLLLWKLEENPLELEGIFLEECGNESIEDLPASPKRRMEFFAERILLKRHLNAELYHDSYGAPFLSDDSYCISISHYSEYVCIALSDNAIGVDIERWDSRPYRLRERFLSADEQLIESSLGEQKTATMLWCAKEASFKFFRNEGSTITDIELSSFKQESALPFIATITATLVGSRSCNVKIYEFEDFALALTGEFESH